MSKQKQRIKDRLIHWFGLADARHIAEGRAWYREAHNFAAEVAKKYNLPMYKIVGVIAALSPSVAWDSNKRQAEELCRAYVDELPLDEVTVTTYGRQAAKAIEILQSALFQWEGTVESLLGIRAFKTIAFYRNILHLENSIDVTIDRHMIVAAGFERQWTQGAHWCYELLSQAIIEVADAHEYFPFEMQAILWVTIKDLTGNNEPEEDLPF